MLARGERRRASAGDAGLRARAKGSPGRSHVAEENEARVVKTPNAAASTSRDKQVVVGFVLWELWRG